MSPVKFDIILPIFNPSLHSVSLTLGSILCQDFKEFRVIIVDDGSDPYVGDFIAQFVLKHAEFSFCVLRNDKNMGLTKSLNKALLAVTAQCVARIDAGDIWNSTK